MGLSVGVLGPVMMEVDDGPPIAPRSERQALLLGVLVARSGRVATTDELVEALWGAGLPADPPAALQMQVFRLRRDLGASGICIERVGAGYRLVTERGAVDAARFEELLTRARAGSEDTTEALACLNAGLRLWRGSAYQGIESHEAIRQEAARLEELRAEATEARAELLVRAGRAGEAAQCMEALALEHPYRERAVALAMQAFTHQGRHADALRTFQAFRRRLGEDLGLEPSPQLRALESAVLRHQAPTAPLLPVVGLPGNSFVGREVELDDVSARLERTRLVTLTGPPGVGKTRLALHVAARSAARYRDGAHVCELAKLTDPGGVAAAVASTLRLGQRAGRTALEGVVDFLRAKQALLVVENCEHVLDDAREFIAAVLAQTADVDVLATSRLRIGAAGEQRVPVEPLPTPAQDDLAGPAVVLFTDRAAAVRPDFSLTGDNLAAVCELCRRLEGLPLAIELAAARAVARTPSEILGDVSSRLGPLADRRRAVDRHRSIEAVVGWSYDLLSSSEQAVFDGLAVFAGGFTLEAAAAVAVPGEEHVLDALTALVEHSLVDAHEVGGRTRFSMLEPVRQYGEARVERSGLLDDTQARHAAWFTQFLDTAAEGVEGPGEAGWKKAVDHEVPNLRAAHRWCLDHDADGAVRMAASSCLFAAMYGHAEMFSWVEETIERFGMSGHPRLAGVFATAAIGAWQGGDLNGARARAEHALELAPPEEPALTAIAWKALGDTETLSGNLSRALWCFDRVIELATRAGDTLLAFGVIGRGLALGYAGETEQACAELAVAASLPAVMANPSCRAFCDYAAGEARLEVAPAEALVFLRRAHDTAREQGNVLIAGIAGLSALCCAARLGDPAEFMSGCPELIDQFHRAHMWTQLWTAVRTLVEMLARLGRHEAAAVLYGALTASPTASLLRGPDAERVGEAINTLQRHLGQDGFRRACTEGAALGDDHAVAYALEVARAVSRDQPTSLTSL